MALSGFVWKPVSESKGKLTVLFPPNFDSPSTITIQLANGQSVTGKLRGRTNGSRPTYDFPNSGAAYGSNIKVFGPNGVVLSIPNGGSRVENNPTVVSSDGAIPQGGNEGGVGVTESGIAFTQAGDAPSFPAIPRIQVPVVDPLERTNQVGGFNIPKSQNNLALGEENALSLVGTEFKGLQDFNRQARELQQEGITGENIFNADSIGAANSFNRGQIPGANAFNLGEVDKANVANQERRLIQLETALPGARETILDQIEKSKTLSEGRFTSDIEDRAAETAARNFAADGTIARGFGDDSIVGRKTSDLLSAQERLQLTQVGQQGIDRFLQLGTSLAFDQPIKFNPIMDEPLKFEPQQARTSQDVRGAPSVSASQLAVGERDTLNELSTINPQAAIGFDINQNQFQASLDRSADTFNATGIYQSDLEQFYADTFNAQQEASAFNVGTDRQIAESNFDSGSILGSVSSAIGGISGIVSGINAITGGTEAAGGAGGISSVLSSIFGGGAAATPTSIGGSAVVGSATTASGAPGYLLANGSVVAASEAGATTGTAAVGSAGSLSALGPPLAIAAAAIASGRGIHEIYKDYTDGKISESDVKQGLNILNGPGSAISFKGLNSILGSPVNDNDLQNALLLSNPLTAPLALADMVFGLGFGSGKSKEQRTRDSLRNLGEDQGLLFRATNEQAKNQGLQSGFHYIKNSDGSLYNIGIDGKNKLDNYAVNIDGKEDRHSYDIDWSDPRAGESVSLLNPAALMIFGENYQKFMGHLWNASASNTNSLSGMKQNIQSYVSQVGIDYQTGLNLLQTYKAKDKLTDSQFAAFVNSWSTLMLSNGVSQEIIV